MTESAPPGWYAADGDAPGLERYWDGSLWTESTRQAAPPPPAYSTGSNVPARDEWNIGWWLFSFRGRAHRAHFWVGQILVILAFLVIGEMATRLDPDGTGSSGDAGLAIVLLGLFLVAAWAGIAINVKRWHDRDKSGVWLLIAVVPIIGLWALIETGFLPGTPGPNSYGAHRGPP